MACVVPVLHFCERSAIRQKLEWSWSRWCNRRARGQVNNCYEWRFPPPLELETSGFVVTGSLLLVRLFQHATICGVAACAAPACPQNSHPIQRQFANESEIVS